MLQCEYCWLSGDTDWCELTNSACTCGGNGECVIKDKAVETAMEEEENITLREASLRARRKRGMERAS